MRFFSLLRRPFFHLAMLADPRMLQAIHCLETLVRVLLKQAAHKVSSSRRHWRIIRPNVLDASNLLVENRSVLVIEREATGQTWKILRRRTNAETYRM